MPISHLRNDRLLAILQLANQMRWIMQALKNTSIEAKLYYEFIHLLINTN